MSRYAIITFHTSHFALKAKKVLEMFNKKPDIIPVPREFSSSCGFCCRIPWEEKEEVKKILVKNNVEIEGIYLWARDDIKKGKRLSLFKRLKRN